MGSVRPAALLVAQRSPFPGAIDPNRLTTDHRAAEPVVRRLASTLRVIEWRFGRFLSSPAAVPDDPLGWPSRVSK